MKLAVPNWVSKGIFRHKPTRFTFVSFNIKAVPLAIPSQPLLPPSK